MLKRILVVLLLVFTSISMCRTGVVAEDDDNFEVNLSCDHDESFFDNQEKAERIYNAFLGSLGYSAAANTYTYSRHAAEDFPEYYCGAYVNTDGNLVIIVTEEIDENYTAEAWYVDLVNRTGETGFLVRKGEYNFRILLNTATDIAFGELRDELENCSFAGIAIDEYRNTVEVHITNSEYLSTVEALLAGRPCRVIVVEGLDTPTIGISCGEGAVNSTSSFSVAFRARKYVGEYTIYGYLTCGHAFSGFSTVAIDPSQTGLPSNVTIGTVSTGEYQLSGSTDAAFIRTYSGVTLNNNVFGYSTIVNPPIQDSSIGTVIKMRGRTSGLESGVVLDASGMAYYPGVTLNDVVIASYTCANGDSGGAVYSEPNSAGNAKPAGIQSGKKTNGNSIYIKISNALASLGLSLY